MKIVHSAPAVVTTSIAVYLVALGVAWTICTRQAEQSTRRLLVQSEKVYAGTVDDSVDNVLLHAGEEIRDALGNTARTRTLEQMRELAATFHIDEVNVVDTNGICIASNVSVVRGSDYKANPLTAAFLALTNETSRFISQPFRHGVDNKNDYCKYLATAFPDGSGLLQLGYSFDRIAPALDLYDPNALRAWRIGRHGHFDILGPSNRVNGLFLPDELRDDTVYTARENGETVYCRAFTFAGHRFLAVLPKCEYFDARDTSFAILAPTLAAIVLLLLIFVRSLQRAQAAEARHHAAEEAARARDLALAREIQLSCLPAAAPYRSHVPTLDFEVVVRPAREVGGDFYDFYHLDATHVAFVIADVSGKGIAAAMFMMNAKNEIYNALHGERDLATAVRTANRRVCESNEAQMFVTVWAGVVDTETGVVNYVNAGHNRPLVRRANGSVERVAETGGIFLGLFPDADYRAHGLSLEAGDALVLFTDGVTEAMNAARALYGEDRLRRCLASAAPMATDIVAAVEKDVHAFTAGAEQSDDLTVLALVQRETAT